MVDRVASRQGPGTSRESKPRVLSVVALGCHDESALLALAASVARGLDTPLATAIVDSAREGEVRIVEAERSPEAGGAGVAASVGGHTVVLGNAAMLAGLGISVESVGDWPERLRRQGQHVLFVAVDGRTAGFLGVADARD